MEIKCVWYFVLILSVIYYLNAIINIIILLNIYLSISEIKFSNYIKYSYDLDIFLHILAKILDWFRDSFVLF